MKSVANSQETYQRRQGMKIFSRESITKSAGNRRESAEFDTKQWLGHGFGVAEGAIQFAQGDRSWDNLLRIGQCGVALVSSYINPDACH
jgi:hypothetical protein